MTKPKKVRKPMCPSQLLSKYTVPSAVLGIGDEKINIEAITTAIMIFASANQCPQLTSLATR
ncbi:hypothetical protein KUL49_15430 [Alteromonas sp. KUL49]|nr:hypothetical protein KUL49_15430 [Alteromonas sp. KUL49]